MQLQSGTLFLLLSFKNQTSHPARITNAVIEAAAVRYFIKLLAYL